MDTIPQHEDAINAPSAAIRQFSPVTKFLVLLAVSMAVSVQQWSGNLHHQFITDDFDWLRRIPRSANPLLFWHIHDDAFYRPVYFTWFWCIRHINGSDPQEFYGGSIVLNGIVIALLVLLVFRVTKKWVPAILAGVIFAFNGCYGGAISWISSASTLLAALFCLLSLHFWLSFRTRRNPVYYAASLTAFVLAICSKEDALCLPLVLLIFNLAYCQRIEAKRLLLLALPFALLFASYVFIDFRDYQLTAARISAARIWSPDIIQRISVWCQFYIVALVSFLGDYIYLALPVLLLALYTMRFAMHRRRFIVPMLLTIVVTLPIPLASGEHTMASRFFYLPSLAIAVFLTVVILSIVAEIRYSKAAWLDDL